MWQPGQAAPADAAVRGRVRGRGGVAPLAQDRDADADRGMDVVHNANAALHLSEQQRRLPIARHRRELLYLIEKHPVVVMVGHTGCGKTTQLPQYLRQAGWAESGRMVVCTQPRRVAAVSVAVRVAEEMNVRLGDEVGYAVRFDDAWTAGRTQIKFCTDGMLLRETLLDPLLSSYSVVIVDEAHERSVSTDILVGLLRKIQKRRPAMRIVISSATLDAEAFRDFFAAETQPRRAISGPTPRPPPPPPAAASGAAATPTDPMAVDENENNRVAIVSIEGRTHPVDIFYTDGVEPVSDYVLKAMQTVCGLHEAAGSTAGDVLVFLTGVEEIERLVRLLRDWDAEQHQMHLHRRQREKHQAAEDALYDDYHHPNSAAAAAAAAARTGIGARAKPSSGRRWRLSILPLYAGLPGDAQMKVFEPPPKHTRKVVVSTNLAETSVTIDGIVHVVDCGYVKVRQYDPSIDVDSLVVVPVSRSAANQRAGRAGRVRPGCCFRLYPEEAMRNTAIHPAAPVPEIERTNLAMVVLQLKALGIDNVMHFDFMANPAPQQMAVALEQLFALKAIDEQGRLTMPLGRHMAEAPVEPKVAKMLLVSGDRGCSEEMVRIAAMLSVQNVYVTPHNNKMGADAARNKFCVTEGDHITLLNIFNSFLKHHKRADWCKSRFLNYRALVRAVAVGKQLRRFLRRAKVPLVSCGRRSISVARKCIVEGFFGNAAVRLPSGAYKTIRHGTVLHLHPTSVFAREQVQAPQWVVYHEVMRTNMLYMREVLAIDPQWLTDVAPHFYTLPGTTLTDIKLPMHQQAPEAEDEPAAKRPNQSNMTT